MTASRRAMSNLQHVVGDTGPRAHPILVGIHVKGFEVSLGTATAESSTMAPNHAFTSKPDV